MLNKTNMLAILVECAFCDRENDMKNYNPEAMAEAKVISSLVRYNVHRSEIGVFLLNVSVLFKIFN